MMVIGCSWAPHRRSPASSSGSRNQSKTPNMTGTQRHLPSEVTIINAVYPRNIPRALSPTQIKNQRRTNDAA